MGKYVFDLISGAWRKSRMSGLSEIRFSQLFRFYITMVSVFRRVYAMGAEEFDYAADRVWDLPHSLENEDLLDLYK